MQQNQEIGQMMSKNERKISALNCLEVKKFKIISYD